jgi:hypothetical protein
MNARWTCKTMILVVTGLFGLVGCGGSSGEGATGALNIGLTDGPVDNAVAIYIQFTGLELKSAGGPAEIYPIDPDACDVADAAGNCTIDIMKLQGTEYRTLFSKDLPVGDYQWLRLLVNAEQNVVDSYVTVENEDESLMDCPLWIPSGEETGLKIISGMTVTANGVSKYMLDFDARTSITAPPGLASLVEQCLQNYVLKPAIRIVDETEVGSIAGTIDPSVLNTLNAQNEEVLIDGCRDEDTDGIVDHLDIYVFEDFDAQNNPAIADDYDGQNDPITSAIARWNGTNSTYEYEVGYLLAGDYKLGLTCTADVDVMPNDNGLIADNFNCDTTNANTCLATDPPFDFVAERGASVVAGSLGNDGDFPTP